jgi:hypothetical protein
MFQDYAEDENEEEEGNSRTTARPSSTTSSTTPSTTTTVKTTSTTSTTTTTSARAPLASKHFERKEPKSYDSFSNGYPSKNEYPVMSAHSALKWQYLGTRESVKETRNSMSPFARNSKCECDCYRQAAVLLLYFIIEREARAKARHGYD